MLQRSYTSQCNYFHMSKCTHVPRRPCQLFSLTQHLGLTVHQLRIHLIPTQSMALPLKSATRSPMPTLGPRQAETGSTPRSSCTASALQQAVLTHLRQPVTRLAVPLLTFCNCYFRPRLWPRLWPPLFGQGHKTKNLTLNSKVFTCACAGGFLINFAIFIFLTSLKLLWKQRCFRMNLTSVIYLYSYMMMIVHNIMVMMIDYDDDVMVSDGKEN